MSDPSATVSDFEHFAPDMASDPIYQLTRIFVYFLQNLFREAPIGMGLKWRPEQETTELIITDQKPRLDAVEKNPHIICVLGSGKWAGLGLDQLQHVHAMAEQGERTHTDLISMSMSYHCQAKVGLHARRLAWYSSYFTNVYRRILMKGGGLHHIGMDHMLGPESAPTAFTGPVSETEIVSVVATVPFYWQVQWRIRDPAEVFRQVRFELDVNRPAQIYSANNAARFRGARVNGRPVVTQPLEPQLTQIVKDSKFAGE